MPQERYRKPLPYIPWCLFFKFKSYSASCRLSWTGPFLVDWSLPRCTLGHLNPRPRYCHKCFYAWCCYFVPPHCSLSLWGHFISISLVHNCTWCCTILHTLQFSVFTSFLPSFSIFPAPSALPSILRTPFPSCREYAFHTSQISSRLGRSPPITALGRGTPLPTCTQVGHSVPNARFPSRKFPAQLVVK